MEDLISVIVPVYKVEKYIHKCIDSIINQTHKNLEIILVDDGSPDKCGKICDEYAQIDNRIKVIHKENGGLSDARNVGIDIAKGKYITFIDSDDYISNDYVKYMYDMICENKDCQMSICGVERIYVENDVVLENTHENYLVCTPMQAYENLLYDKGIDVCAYAKLYQKELFDNIRFPVGRVYEDSATTYKLIDKCEKIMFGNKKCYFYLARPGSISKQGKFNDNENDYIEFTKEMLEYIRNKYPQITRAVNRYDIYSKFRILRMLVFTKPRNKQFEKDILLEIKNKRKDVFFDKNTPKRDKMAIILSFLGIGIYKMSWYFYSKLTKRIL